MNRFFASLALITAFAAVLPAAHAQDPATPAPPATPTTPTTPATPPPPAPVEDDQDKRRPGIGPDIGFFLPTSDRTRAAFGSTWINYGLGLQPIESITHKGALGYDIYILSTFGSNRRAFLVPASIIYKRAIGGSSDTSRGITPYVGASLGLLFADLRSDNYNVHSGFRMGYGGSALLGLTFQRSAYLEARYQAFNKIKGFDLSGLSITAGLRF